jgi:hypothetical protein
LIGPSVPVPVSNLPRKKMQKPVVAACLLLTSTLACADVYVGAGYQGASLKVERDALRNPVVDGRALDLSARTWSDGLRLMAGTSLHDNWALELTFQQAGVDDDATVIVDATQEEEWEATVDGFHVTLAPVYLHRLGENLDLRATAGLLYGKYDVRQSHYIDVEDGADQPISRASDSRSRLGGMVGLGLGFRTPWKFELLADAQYQRTSVLAGPAFSLTAVHRF